MNSQKPSTETGDNKASDSRSDITDARKFVLPSRFKGAELSVWNEFMTLDMTYKSINLGQGFPNFSPPEWILETLKNANDANEMLHQHLDIRGLLRLRKILCHFYSQEMHRLLDPDTEILITCGAYEALYCSINGLIDNGDEVIIIEPFFDCYEPMTLVAGGIIRSIPLRKTGSGLASSDWKLEENELRGLFNAKTKIIIVNSPMNPIGKIFSEKELKLISELCVQYNVICIMDEVYEWLNYNTGHRIRMGETLDLSSEDDFHQDFRFAKWMIKNISISSIPATAFYLTRHKHIGERLIRFCFIKTEETLNKSAQNLERLKLFLK